MKKPYIRIMKITPELAAEWLKKNSKNQRDLKPAKVKYYMREMQAGRWSPTAGDIYFDTAGKMFNGQHRLTAVIRTGLTVYMSVKFNCDPDDFMKIDRGAQRDNGDVLQIMGETKGKLLSSSINWVSKIENALTGKKSAVTIRDGGGLAPEEMLAYLDNNPGIRDSIEVVDKLKVQQLKVPRALAVAIHYTLASANDREATRFIRTVFTGENLTRKSVTYLLRDRLLVNATSKAANAKLNTLAQVGLFLKAWNLHRKGLCPSRLSYKAHARNPERLPLP